MDNKVCVKINCYKGFNYFETLEGIANAGFKYVELSTSKGNSLDLTQDISKPDLKKLINDLKRYDLTPIAIGGNSYLMDDDTSRILANIKLAKMLGCKYIDTTMFNARNDENSITSKDEIIRHINFYLPYLQRNNLDLVIELHGKYATGKILSEILKDVKSSNVHINYDTGNALYCGGLNIGGLLRDFKENVSNISYMHLKDKLDEINVWNFPAIGKGYIPFEMLFNTLKENNNNCCLCVEIEFTSSGVKDVNEVNEALIDSANYLKSLGLNIGK